MSNTPSTKLSFFSRILKPGSSNSTIRSARGQPTSQPADKSATKECVICYDDPPPSSFLPVTLTCLHEDSVCRACVNNHIKSELDRKGNVSISCLYEGCGQLLQYSDVKRLAEPVQFERFDTLSLRQTLSEMPDFRWCKNAGCGSGQIHFEKEDAPIVTCEACNRKSCYTHDVPWHEGMTCENYDEMTKGAEAATKDYLQRETKPCPKCGVHIFKTGGCNHMQCKVRTCGYEFCWLCLADYNNIRRDGNSQHKSSCQLYA